MSPRSLFAAIATLMCIAPISAQQANVGAWQGGYPVSPINGGGYADPYATVSVTSPLPWFGGAPILSTPASIQDRLWLRAEYLRWWTEGMDIPPLITTSPTSTPQDQAAVLGEPGTGVLFGGREINGDSVNGARTSAGFWLTRDAAFGIEGEFFILANQNDGYFGSSDGTTILGRPFFDIVNGRETAQLISFPDVVAGNVEVASNTDLTSFLINGRAALTPLHNPACDIHQGKADRVDLILGYRYLDLDDRIVVGEGLESLVAGAPGTIAISERFDTSNEFNGLQLGVAYQANFRRASLESLLRVAVGNNTQTVRIQGSTSITENGVTENFNGGVLAQRTNIGTYERDQFTMIPELGFTLGFRVTDWLHATAGYTVVYFPSVVRAGDQIDSDLNPNLLAPESVPFSGAERPRFRYRESDYWAQGISLGGEIRF